MNWSYCGPLTSKIFILVSAGVAQLARASAFQAEGRGFESRFPLHMSAHIAQAAEHFLGKEEVIGSSPIVGSIFQSGLQAQHKT